MIVFEGLILQCTQVRAYVAIAEGANISLLTQHRSLSANHFIMARLTFEAARNPLTRTAEAFGRTENKQNIRIDRVNLEQDYFRIGREQRPKPKPRLTS